jgi:hypothetical protein
MLAARASADHGMSVRLGQGRARELARGAADGAEILIFAPATGLLAPCFAGGEAAPGRSGV